MTDIVKIEKINAVYMKVTADPGIRQELSEYFSFRPAGYQFVQSYKNRVWDGYYRLYQPFKPVLLAGLWEYVAKFCHDREYILEIDDDFNTPEEIPESYIAELAKEIGAKYTPYDYQVKYILNAIRNNRSLSLSPTSSGKSLIQYFIQQHYYTTYGHRTLIIVPTIGLVHQMAGDFVDYGCDPDKIYKIQGGVDKNTKSPVVISTWQSLIKQPKEWFEQFRVVLGDECLHPDSKITMEDGTVKKIIDIHIGDKVKTLNETTGTIEFKPVLKKHKNLFFSGGERRYKIKTKSGKELIITGNHKVYTDNGWKEVKHLTKSDRIAKL